MFALGTLLLALASAGCARVSDGDRYVIGPHNIGSYRFAWAVSETRALPRLRAALGVTATEMFRYQDCRLYFPSLRLRVDFLDLLTTGSGEQRDCQFFSATASSPLWHTRNGLRVGTSLADLHRFFPRAVYFVKLVRGM